MNKKGFTLVEICVSLMLISIVLIFLMNFLTTVRKSENTVSINNKLEISKSCINHRFRKIVEIADELQ